MYHQAYGIIETLAALHVGASAGEESGNLNLIFREQFTQTGIIPASSIRGRFRAEMRDRDRRNKTDLTNLWYGQDVGNPEDEGDKPAPESGVTQTQAPAKKPKEPSEGLVKFEYASLVWMPVYCPGQPVVWISCRRLLRRYQQITGITATLPQPYTASRNLRSRPMEGTNLKILFFNLGFMELEHQEDLSPWIPKITLKSDLSADKLVVVDDGDMAMLHDMALYRQTRVKLDEKEKKVSGSAFFNVEALPEGSLFVFVVALKETGWKPFGDSRSDELYFGGLESVGFGRCRVTLSLPGDQ